MKDENKLTINGNTIIFDKKIGHIEKRNDKTFILIESTSNLLYPQSNYSIERYRNILAFDSSGDMLWAIEEANLVTEIDVAGPYTSLFVEDGKLCAYHISGYYYLIDEGSGKINPRDNSRPW